MSESIQLLDQPLAYEYQRALDILCKALEAFEGYVNKTGRNINSQIYGTGKWIKDYGGSAWDFQETFLIHSMICGATFADKSMLSSVREFTKKEFYKWINRSGIPADNCPRDLAHFLIEMRDILDGDNKKIVRENNQNLENKKKPSIKVHNETFFEYQKFAHETEEKKESFGNKKLNEVGIQGQFGEDDWKKGEEIFTEIEKKYRREHNAYYLFVPYGEQQEGNQKSKSDLTSFQIANSDFSSIEDNNDMDVDESSLL